jgi:hypothetical protein
MTRRRAPLRRETRLKSRSSDNPVIAANGRPTHCLLDGSVRHPDAERRDRECREQRADQALAVRHDQVAGLVPRGIHVLGVLRVRTYIYDVSSDIAARRLAERALLSEEYARHAAAERDLKLLVEGPSQRTKD